MNTPSLYSPEGLTRHASETSTKVQRNGKDVWIPCRPLGWQGLRLGYRLKLAWGVFIAKYDVVDWGPEQRRML